MVKVILLFQHDWCSRVPTIQNINKRCDSMFV
uniref:Uncharacterized protein n=1 Tax=Rhizophora mucronata TaxID=61149 RepID=A0A2P2N0T2_RHIMU